MEVKFEGMPELLKQLQSMENGVGKAKEKALIAGAEVVQKAAQNEVRVRTGTLKENIEKSEVENDQIEVYVDNQGRAYYGHMLEFGTSKMQAIPFMGPSFMRNQLKIEQAMTNSIRESLGLLI
ncbi:HK97-gp10 family putative phage morphogenesis protein [Gracilibacillus dipsosauri]|jgi:HK97 gp10 family phage protein|uniref:HK97-gp10 family putative phage morphogenesis protein n=1 Tax=Gracilibacillus dipsosauri TaxID=178340 RepID=UPI00240A07E8